MRKSLIAAITALALGGAIAAPASASAATAGTACGYMMSTGAYACFDTINEVNNWAAEQAGGRVSVSASGASSADSVSPASSFLLGILYQDSGYNTPSLSLFGSGACNGNHTNWEFEYGGLSALGWDNRTSSFQGYSNCWIKLFENPNYNTNKAGSTYGPYDHASYVGDAMNDQASSVRFF